MITYKPTNARYWCVADLECTGLEPPDGESQSGPTLGPDSATQGAIPPAAQQERGPSPVDGGGCGSGEPDNSEVKSSNASLASGHLSLGEHRQTLVEL